MLNVTTTFSFLTDAQGFTCTGDGSATFAWTGSDGSPAGCVEVAAVNTSVPTNVIHTTGLTWEDLGVPHGSFALYVDFTLKCKYVAGGSLPSSMPRLGAKAGEAEVGGPGGAAILVDASAGWHDVTFPFPLFPVPNANHASDTAISVEFNSSGGTDDLGTLRFDEFSVTVYYDTSDADVEGNLVVTPDPCVVAPGDTVIILVNRLATFALEDLVGSLSDASGITTTYTAPLTPGNYYLDVNDFFATGTRTYFLLIHVEAVITCIYGAIGGYQHDLTIGPGGTDEADLHDGTNATGFVVESTTYRHNDPLNTIAAGVNLNTHTSPDGIGWTNTLPGGGSIVGMTGGVVGVGSTSNYVFNDPQFADFATGGYDLRVDHTVLSNAGGFNKLGMKHQDGGGTWIEDAYIQTFYSSGAWHWSAIVTPSGGFTATGTLGSEPTSLRMNGNDFYVNGTLVATSTVNINPFQTKPFIQVIPNVKFSNYLSIINPPPHRLDVTAGIYLGEGPDALSSLSVYLQYNGAQTGGSPPLLENSPDNSSWSAASLASPVTLSDHGGSVAGSTVTFHLTAPVAEKYWRLSLSTTATVDLGGLGVMEMAFLNEAGVSLCGGFNPCGGGARPVGEIFASVLQGECLTLACCLKLSRSDGTVTGFTTLDQDLVIDAVTYEAQDGLGLSNLRTKVGTGIDNTDITGLQTANRVVEADLHGGRYDGARIELFAVNYESLSDGKITLLTGTIGQVIFSDGGFTFEARSLTQRLSQQVGELYSPLCPAVLGDARCKVNLAAFTFARTVTGIPDRENMVFGSDSHGDDYYTYGLVTFTSGLNSGLSRPVRAHLLVGGNAQLSVQEPFPFNIAAGDTADLQAGDDRRFATCRDKFANAANYRGFPHIPRSDALITVQRSG